MSLEPSVEEKRKIELPKALREIMRLISEEGPMTYEELAQKLNKDPTTIIRQAQKLLELELVTKVEKEGKTAIAVAEGVEVDEEGNAYIPSPFEDPIEKLKQLLEEAGVKGRKLRWIMRLVETNPEALQQPQVLYETLTGAGIRRHLAEQIVKAYFGTNFVAPQPPMMQPGMQPYPYYRPPMYQYQYYGYQPYPPVPPTVERDLVRLEMRLEKLMEEIREKKEEKPYPVIRKMKVDETGKPVEVIEEPAFVAGSRSDDMVKWMIQLMQQQQKDREDLLKTIYQIQQQQNQAIEKLVEAMKEERREFQQQMQQIMTELERKRIETEAKLREEMHKRELELMKQRYEDRIRDLEETVQGIKQYYENEFKKAIEDLKREWEWREKLREAEERKGLRDVVVSELRELAKEGRETFKLMRDQWREYMESRMKERMREVPEVTKEEKKRLLERLRRATGRAAREEREEKEEKEEEEEIEYKIVGGEGGEEQ